MVIYFGYLGPPSLPSAVSISSVTSNSVYGTFSNGASNGSTIDQQQIGYGTSSSSPQTTISSDRSTTITGLIPGTTYYFWARSHNAYGWSGWGPRSSATTLRVPDAPNPAVISDITQTSVDVSFTTNGNGGSSIIERQIAYGTSSSAPSNFATYTSVLTITGLAPGTTYYFWTRVRNSVGWSPYSEVRSIKTVGGVYLKVGAVWKIAIPYVKDAGVWKLARPWVRISGEWKETS